MAYAARLARLQQNPCRRHIRFCKARLPCIDTASAKQCNSRNHSAAHKARAQKLFTGHKVSFPFSSVNSFSTSKLGVLPLAAAREANEQKGNDNHRNVHQNIIYPVQIKACSKTRKASAADIQHVSAPKDHARAQKLMSFL